MEGQPRATSVTDRITAQAALFASPPARSSIVGVTPAQLGAGDDRLRSVAIDVWRNHGVEAPLRVAAPFLWLAGLDPDFRLSGYDDSFSFHDPRPGATLHIVWIDLDRVSYDADELDGWLGQRVAALQSHTAAPILVVTLSSSIERGRAAVGRLADCPGVLAIDLAGVAELDGIPLVEERLAAMTGSMLARDASTLVGRLIGTRWIPAMTLPTLKLIVVDLDGTLHRGVLGEDGIDGVEIGPAHRALGRDLTALHRDGFMLALCSKNDPAHVAELFARRGTEYGLNLDEFMFVAVSWDPKEEAISRMVDDARIGFDSVLFVDDNPNELIRVGLSCPGIGLLQATDDGSTTRDALALYPQLWRWRADDVAQIREQDLRANADRAALATAATTTSDYLRELEVVVEVTVNDETQVPRFVELANKTNQFNLTLARPTDVEVRAGVLSGRTAAVSIALSDRLSDSGVVGVILVDRDNERHATVRELSISCRALGRGLEDLMVAAGLLAAFEALGAVDAVSFTPARGPRNEPALRWLQSFATTDGPPEGTVTVSLADLAHRAALPGVTIRHAVSPASL